MKFFTIASAIACAYVFLSMSACSMAPQPEFYCITPVGNVHAPDAEQGLTAKREGEYVYITHRLANYVVPFSQCVQVTPRR